MERSEKVFASARAHRDQPGEHQAADGHGCVTREAETERDGKLNHEAGAQEDSAALGQPIRQHAVPPRADKADDPGRDGQHHPDRRWLQAVRRTRQQRRSERGRGAAKDYRARAGKDVEDAPTPPDDAEDVGHRRRPDSSSSRHPTRRRRGIVELGRV